MHSIGLYRLIVFTELAHRLIWLISYNVHVLCVCVSSPPPSHL